MLIKVKVASLIILSCACLANRDSGQSHNTRNQREDEYNRVMLFMADPMRNFGLIENIQNPFKYIGIAEANSKDGIFEHFLKLNFSEADDKRAKILIFLIMLEPKGELGEILVEHIIDLFDSRPKPFLRVLRKRTDWAKFVEMMKAGSWMDFVSATRRLPNSGFEGTFKRYVLR